MWVEKASDQIREVIDPIAKALVNIAMYIMVLMVLGVLADIIIRVMGLGVPGIDELEEFMMVMVTFFALAYVGIRRGHVAVELVVSRFPQRLRAAIITGNDILALIFLSIITWQTALYAAASTAHHSDALDIPVTLVISILPIGCGLLGFVVLADLLHDFGETVKNKWWPGFALIIGMPLIVFTSPTWLGWLGVSSILMGFLALVLMVVLIFLGLPIVYSLGIAGLIGVSHMSSWQAAFTLAGSVPYSSVADFFLASIPFFVLMGSLAAISGISRDLFQTAKVWLGRLPGSLGMATIVGGAAFGAVCGDSFASAATIGKVALPQMRKEKYDNSLAGGAVAVAGSLGEMIPPSIVFIIYALLTQESVGKLFFAGICPGLLIAGLLMGTIFLRIKFNPALAPRGEQTSLKTKMLAIKDTWGMLVLFVLVMGGIYAGLFTPVEAGAVGAAGAFLFAVSKRMLSKRAFNDALLEAAHICGMLLFMFVGISLLKSTLALSKIPILLAEFFANLAVSRWVIFAGIVLMYIAFGTVMAIVPVVMLTLPILLPTLIALDFNLIWFGVIIEIMVMIGQSTPPVGIICYIVKSVAGDYMSLEEIFKGASFMWGALIVGLILIVLFPQIALFLPGLMQ